MDGFADLKNGEAEFGDDQMRHEGCRSLDLVDPLADMDGGEGIFPVEGDGVFPVKRVALRLAVSDADHVIGGGVPMGGVNAMDVPETLLRFPITEAEVLGENEVPRRITPAIGVANKGALRLAAGVFENSPGAIMADEVAVEFEVAWGVRKVLRLEAGAGGEEDARSEKQSRVDFASEGRHGICMRAWIRGDCVCIG